MGIDNDKMNIVYAKTNFDNDKLDISYEAINKEKNFASAVVYVRNNENNMKVFITNLNDVLKANFAKYEIIFVNDASTDNSTGEIKEYADTIQNSVISILNMSYYQGLELSMNAGVDLSIGDFVYEFDTIEIDYDLKVIMEVYYQSLGGYDIVSASSNTKQKVSSSLFYWVFNKAAKNQYMLGTESFRILSRRAINRVHAMSKTIPYRKAVYANCGLKLGMVKYDSTKPVVYEKSKNKMSMKQEVAIDALILFTDLAYKFTIAMTLLMMLITVIAAIYAVVIFMIGSPIAGWTTTILFLAFSFFGLFAILAIIIKFLSILVDLVFKKQKYVFESIEKISK